ncbi:hypothetical protein ABFS83_08G045100 [Erythranthe nasuta]
MESLMDCEFTFDEASGKLPISAILGPNYLAAKLYKNCSLGDLELSKMLIRPSLVFLGGNAQEIVAVTSELRLGETLLCMRG